MEVRNQSGKIVFSTLTEFRNAKLSEKCCRHFSVGETVVAFALANPFQTKIEEGDDRAALVKWMYQNTSPSTTYEEYVAAWEKTPDSVFWQALPKKYWANLRTVRSGLVLYIRFVQYWTADWYVHYVLGTENFILPESTFRRGISPYLKPSRQIIVVPDELFDQSFGNKKSSTPSQLPPPAIQPETEVAPTPAQPETVPPVKLPTTEEESLPRRVRLTTPVYIAERSKSFARDFILPGKKYDLSTRVQDEGVLIFKPDEIEKYFDITAYHTIALCQKASRVEAIKSYESSGYRLYLDEAGNGMFVVIDSSWTLMLTRFMFRQSASKYATIHAPEFSKAPTEKILDAFERFLDWTSLEMHHHIWIERVDDALTPIVKFKFIRK